MANPKPGWRGTRGTGPAREKQRWLWLLDYEAYATVVADTADEARRRVLWERSCDVAGDDHPAMRHVRDALRWHQNDQLILLSWVPDLDDPREEEA